MRGLRRGKLLAVIVKRILFVWEVVLGCGSHVGISRRLAVAALTERGVARTGLRAFL